MSNIVDLDGRYDLYGSVHKGLRKAGCELLVKLGAVDYDDAPECEAALANLRAYLSLAASHLSHEEDNIHDLLQQRGGSSELADDRHRDHRTAFVTLETLAAEVEMAGPRDKTVAGRRLYLAFAAHLSADLAHMHEEETIIAPTLWRNFSDAELAALEARIVGSMPPEKNMAFMRQMIPAMNPSERAALLGAVQKEAPPEVFGAVIEFAVRPGLTEKAFGDLTSRLRIAV
jgi:hypothetical protein